MVKKIYNYLFETDNVGVTAELPMVQKLAFHVLVYLHLYGRGERSVKYPASVIGNLQINWIYLEITFNPWLLAVQVPLTFSPRSMNLTATSSPVFLSRINLATPKFPLPISRICIEENLHGSNSTSTGRYTYKHPLSRTKSKRMLFISISFRDTDFTVGWSSQGQAGPRDAPPVPTSKLPLYKPMLSRD